MTKWINSYPLFYLQEEQKKNSNIIRITHAETESKFKKTISALKSSYKKKQETTRRNKTADG